MAVVSGIATPAAEAIADEAIAHKNKTKEKSHPHTLSDPANQNTPNKQRKKKLFPYHHPPPTPFTTPKKTQKKKEKKREKIKREKVHAMQKVVPYFGGKFLGKKNPKKNKQTNKQSQVLCGW
jgi:hypothetical protein